MATVLLVAMQVVTFAIIARAVLSWLPIKEASVWGRIDTLLRRVTDPILRRIRRLLPRTGGIDLSPMVAILAISLVLIPIARIL